MMIKEMRQKLKNAEERIQIFQREYNNVLQDLLKYKENSENSSKEKVEKYDKVSQTEASSRKTDINLTDFLGSYQSEERSHMNKTFQNPEKSFNKSKGSPPTHVSNEVDINSRKIKQSLSPIKKLMTDLQKKRSERSKSKGRQPTVRKPGVRSKSKKSTSRISTKTFTSPSKHKLGAQSRLSKKGRLTNKSATKGYKKLFGLRNRRESSRNSTSSFTYNNTNKSFKKKSYTKHMQSMASNQSSTENPKFKSKRKSLTKNVYSNMFNKHNLQKKRENLAKTINSRHSSKSNTRRMSGAHKVKLKEIIKSSLNENYGNRYNKQTGTVNSKSHSSRGEPKKNMRNLKNVYQKI